MVPSWREPVASILPELIELRHEFHRHPELGYHETRTGEVLVRELSKIDGLVMQTDVAGTGVVAVLNGNRDGRCVALRADMDALPIREVGSVPYRSEIDGCMHACGHDGHIACLIGAARVLSSRRDELPGKVKFIFQPAEEGGGGGRAMVEAGVLRDPDVDAVFAMHGWPDVPFGSILVGSGAVFAASSFFEIELVGRGGHAAFPHHSGDLILAASQLVVRLQAIASRWTDPTEPVVVSVCAIHAGDAHNVMPDRCRLSGTTRGLHQETHDRAAERMQALAESTAAEFGATAHVKIIEPYPALVNHPDASVAVTAVARELLGPDQVDDRLIPTMGAEDFAFFAREVPGALWRLGIGPTDGSGGPKLHQPDFDFPDDAIAIGVEMHCRLAARVLEVGLGVRC